VEEPQPNRPASTTPYTSTICAGHVEARAVRCLAAIAYDGIRHQRRRDRDRRIDQQDPAPGELLRDDPPEQDARGAAEAVHRRPRADRAVKLRARWKRRRDDGQRGRRHQRAGKTLPGSGADQQAAVRGDAACQRGDREEAERRDEHAPLAEMIGRASTEQQEARERDRVRVDDPLQVGRGEAKA
jgi:hypothetical protein